MKTASRPLPPPSSQKLQSLTAELESQQPKYVLLAQSILIDIKEGRYAVGELLPTEEALCLAYGVSRHTVRSAIRLLQDREVVRSQRPIGTRVVSAEPAHKYSLHMTSVSDIVQLAAGTKQMVISIEDIQADEATAAEIGCAIDQQWRKVAILRWLTPSLAAPNMLSQIYIHPMYRDLASNLRLKKLTPSKSIVVQMIEEKYGEKVAEIRQSVSAIGLVGELAQAFKVPDSTPGLNIQRWMYARDRTMMLYTNGTYLGTSYNYTTSLTLGKANVAL